jgi:hypothetical protein
MNIPLATSGLFGAMLLASCQSTESTTNLSDSNRTPIVENLPNVGFKQIEFGTGGGFAGGGTGQFLRLRADGLLIKVVAKPFKTDSGDVWSGKYDTASASVRNEDLVAADSILRSRAVMSPDPLPESAYDSCDIIFDGFYWLATATYSSDSTSRWSAPSMWCHDRQGGTVATPVSEGIKALQTLETRLKATYFGVEPAR